MRRTLLILAIVAILGGLGGAAVVGGDPPCATIEEGGHVYVSPPDCVPHNQPQPNGGG